MKQKINFGLDVRCLISNIVFVFFRKEIILRSLEKM